MHSAPGMCSASCWALNQHKLDDWKDTHTMCYSYIVAVHMRLYVFAIWSIVVAKSSSSTQLVALMAGIKPLKAKRSQFF